MCIAGKLYTHIIGRQLWPGKEGDVIIFAINLQKPEMQTGNCERSGAVLSEIEAAFSGVSREGGVTLHEATAIDDYATQAQRESARARDQETRWQDVPDADIASNYSVFSFLDDIGRVYYAPAYM